MEGGGELSVGRRLIVVSNFDGLMILLPNFFLT